ncbi:hypothetical protein IWX64_002827 [Arthrobacter sp. CAN_A212]|uniref:DUF6318 family protein n=1 Tax=Arthrobacter sp. CAN_A212 TaxID=2787719 RepID=UPI0018C9C079
MAVVLGYLMTGCEGDASPPGPSATVTSASAPEQTTSTSPPPMTTPPEPTTPEPTAASSDGPAANIPVPEKPALADENSVEGLEAFTEYWFELFSYGYITNDWDEFDSITDSACASCSNIKQVVQGIYDQGRWLGGGEFEVLNFASEFEKNTSGSFQSFVENRQDDITYFESDGSEIRTDPSPTPVIDVMFADYSDGAWKILDYGKPEGT